MWLPCGGQDDRDGWANLAAPARKRNVKPAKIQGQDFTARLETAYSFGLAAGGLVAAAAFLALAASV